MAEIKTEVQGNELAVSNGTGGKVAKRRRGRKTKADATIQVQVKDRQTQEAVTGDNAIDNIANAADQVTVGLAKAGSQRVVKGVQEVVVPAMMGAATEATGQVVELFGEFFNPDEIA